MNTRYFWQLPALALLLTLSGCGGNLVKVTGKVTYKGEPVPSTDVTFQPDDGSRHSVGHTDDQGNFTLKYSRDEVGATRGPHTVFLNYVPSNEEETGTIPPKASKELKAVIKKHGDPKTSGLHYEITKSGQFIEIKLD